MKLKIKEKTTVVKTGKQILQSIYDKSNIKIIERESKKRQTSKQIMDTIAQVTTIPVVNVVSVFSALQELMFLHMSKKGSGSFRIPMGDIKIMRVNRKARKARTLFSPLTGKEEKIPAIPKGFSVKIKPLKKLKAAVKE